MSGKGGFGKISSRLRKHRKSLRLSTLKQRGLKIFVSSAYTRWPATLVAVTLNSALKVVDYKDIVLSMPSGTWKSLNPSFNNMQLKKAQRQNRFGNTVILYETLEQFGEYTSDMNETAASGLAGDMNDAIKKAEYLISWQMDHGGWTKAMPYDRAWNGVGKKSTSSVRTA